ncbi:MAG: hypothetical protein AAB592_05180 [Patescibacteria group bacterium]
MDQRRFAVYFFFFTIFLCVGIIAWVFWLNKGVLIISGPAPFEVSIGKERGFVCEFSPCSLSLQPDEYVMATRKSGYFDESLPVRVRRFREEPVTLSFRFIPQVQEVGAFELPSKLSSISNNFSGVVVDGELTALLGKIPAAARRIEFGADYRNAVVYIGREVYLALSGSPPTLEKSTFHESFSPAFVGNRVATLEFTDAQGGYKSSSQADDNKFTAGASFQQKLFLYPVADASPEVLTVFQRPLSSPRIISSPSATRLLVIDSSTTGKTLYLVDIARKTKQKLSLPEAITDVRFVEESHIVYSQAEIVDGVASERFMIFNADTQVSREVPIANINSIISFDGNFVIATTDSSAIQLNQDQSRSSGITFEEILKTATPLSEKKPEINFAIARLDIITGAYETLATLAEAVDFGDEQIGSPSDIRLDFSAEKNTIYFVYDGNVYGIAVGQ